MSLTIPAFAAAPGECFIKSLPDSGFSEGNADASGYVVKPASDLKIVAVGYPSNHLDAAPQYVRIAEMPSAGWGGTDDRPALNMDD